MRGGNRRKRRKKSRGKKRKSLKFFQKGHFGAPFFWGCLAETAIGVYYGGMIVLTQDYDGKEATGREMYRMVSDFWLDVAPFMVWDFPDWFDFVRAIPYVSDDQLFPDQIVELLSRPWWLLDPRLFPGMDCKKKAILIACWAYANRCPFRFLAVSEVPSKKIHHVFPQIDFGNGWENCDATFPSYRIGQKYPITYAEELTP